MDELAISTSLAGVQTQKITFGVNLRIILDRYEKYNYKVTELICISLSWCENLGHFINLILKRRFFIKKKRKTIIIIIIIQLLPLSSERLSLSNH